MAEVNPQCDCAIMSPLLKTNVICTAQEHLGGGRGLQHSNSIKKYRQGQTVLLELSSSSEVTGN